MPFSVAKSNKLNDSQFQMYIRTPWGFCEDADLDSVVLGCGRDPAFLARPQVMPVLLVQALHFGH